MKTIKVDKTEAVVDDIDYERVSKYKWHLHNGKPRARIYLKPPGKLNLVAKSHQIPLARFVWKLTRYTNTKIYYPKGDFCDCRKSQMLLTAKDPSKPRFIGIYELNGLYYAKYEKYEKGPFVSDVDAAREYDKLVIEYEGWRAETNFYPQMFKDENDT